MMVCPEVITLEIVPYIAYYFKNGHVMKCPHTDLNIINPDLWACHQDFRES